MKDLIAELNDLLQLDHDAVRAYTVAINNLESPILQEQIIEFRHDHEVHIEDLEVLIRVHGGEPISQPHAVSSIFKLLMQQEGRIGGDRGILAAFKTNEAEARDKYVTSADAPHPVDVALVLRRNALDEVRHYQWAEAALEAMGLPEDSKLGRVQKVVEKVQGGMAEAAESAERWLRSHSRL